MLFAISVLNWVFTSIIQSPRFTNDLVFVKDSILGNWQKKNEHWRHEENRVQSESAEGARICLRRKGSAASLLPEAQEIPWSGIESLLLWPNSYRLQVTLAIKIGYAPSRRSTDLLPNLTQHAAKQLPQLQDPAAWARVSGIEFQKISSSCMLLLDIDLGPI